MENEKCICKDFGFSLNLLCPLHGAQAVRRPRTYVHQHKGLKPNWWIDMNRDEFALQLKSGVPIRIHAPNGSYLFSLVSDHTGTWRYVSDFSDHPKAGTREQITWELPI